MGSTRIDIEIYSDVICPWCYVGKRRLDRALHQMSDTVGPCVVWRPFQLNPTMPKEGMDRTAYLAAKFGSLDAFKEMEQRLLEVGSAEQIPFAFQEISRNAEYIPRPSIDLVCRTTRPPGCAGGIIVQRLF